MSGSIAVGSLLFLSGCGGGGSAGSSSSGTAVTAIDGYIKDATIKDATGQVAIYTGSIGLYLFSSPPVYPLTLTGGRYEDTNDSFDINLTASSGSVLSPITTFLGDDLNLLSKFDSLGLNKSTFDDFAVDYIEDKDTNLTKLSQLLYVMLKYKSLTTTFKQSIENNDSLDSLDKLFVLAESDIDNSAILDFKQKHFVRKLLHIAKDYGEKNATTLYDDYLKYTKLLPSDIVSNGQINIEKLLQDTKRSLNGDFSLQKRSPLIVKTGQTTSYVANDDGDLQIGVDRNYTRDDIKEVVIDNVTGLIWQDNNDANTIQKTWADAKTYCQNLTLGGYDDWRLPAIEELYSITDKGRYNPSIDPTFLNTASSVYWSSTTGASNTSYAWVVYFSYDYDGWDVKSHTHYVRCVRIIIEN